MCLAVPSRVISIDRERDTAVVESMGVSREASLSLMEEGSVAVGDYVLLHIGFVMNTIDEAHALESLALYSEILQKLDNEE